MRLRISTVLLVLALVLAGWPGMSRACGMSCCAPTAVVEVQFTQDMPGCCCCSDDVGNCGWERATHQRKPLVAVSSEQNIKEVRPGKALALPTFLQVSTLQSAQPRGRFSIAPTGPPLPTDRTILLQVILC